MIGFDNKNRTAVFTKGRYAQYDVVLVVWLELKHCSIIVHVIWILSKYDCSIFRYGVYYESRHNMETGGVNWTPLTEDHERGERFHVMTWSWNRCWMLTSSWHLWLPNFMIAVYIYLNHLIILSFVSKFGSHHAYSWEIRCDNVVPNAIGSFIVILLSEWLPHYIIVSR